MARNSKSILDYQRLASEKNLRFISPLPPSSVNTQVRWECLLCGRIHTKSYRAVTKTETGCYCQNSNTISPADYHILAANLGGALFREDLTPVVNTKTPVKWETRNGEIIEASYASLAYNPSKSLLERFGV